MNLRLLILTAALGTFGVVGLGAGTARAQQGFAPGGYYPPPRYNPYPGGYSPRPYPPPYWPGGGYGWGGGYGRGWGGGYGRGYGGGWSGGYSRGYGGHDGGGHHGR